MFVFVLCLTGLKSEGNRANRWMALRGIRYDVFGGSTGGRQLRALAIGSKMIAAPMLLFCCCGGEWKREAKEQRLR